MANFYRAQLIKTGSVTLIGRTVDNNDSGIIRSAPLADGLVGPTHLAVTAQNPQHQSTTLDIDTAFALCGVAGLRVGGALTLFYGRVDGDTGIFEADGNDVSIAYSDAFSYLQNITVVSKQVAVANVVSMGFSGITQSAEATVSGTPGVTKQYGLGAVTLNGSAISQITQVTINPGCTPIMDESDGNIFPNDIQLEQRNPTIEIVSTELDALLGGTSGVSLSSTGLVVKLRRYTNLGTFQSGTVNITAAIAAGTIYPTVRNGRPVAASYTVQGIESGGNNLVITTGVA